MSADLGNEPHPAANSAYRWLKGYMVLHTAEWLLHKEAMASTALAGNRQAEVCLSTINRLAKGEPVSDRYILGLAWTIMHLDNFEAIDTVESAAIGKANPRSEAEL